MNLVPIMTETIFNKDFIDIPTSKIVSDLKTEGYFAFEQALNENFIGQLLKEIDFNKILLNNNDIGVVISQEVRFFTHCLASSKKTYDIITFPKVLEICKGYFTDTFRLTNHRIYETCKSSSMPWHTDNNKQDGSSLSEKHDMPGLLFLFYLSDVDQNAFQLIRNSHNWSHKYNDEIYLSESFIDSNYGNDVLTFLMKKGSLILCDTHAIHRAKPFHDKKYKRITLLFQVDQVGINNAGHGEKNIINTEYLENLSPELVSYLGFGFKRDYPAFPTTSIATMSVTDILRLQNQLISKTFLAVGKTCLKALVPPKFIISMKRLRWRLKMKYAKKVE